MLKKKISYLSVFYNCWQLCYFIPSIKSMPFSYSHSNNVQFNIIVLNSNTNFNMQIRSHNIFNNFFHNKMQKMRIIQQNKTTMPNLSSYWCCLDYGPQSRKDERNEIKFYATICKHLKTIMGCSCMVLVSNKWN